jgi:nucleoside-diphosphate-sugar epimerase
MGKSGRQETPAFKCKLRIRVIQGDFVTKSNPKAPILVTGASGYVAGWIIKDLLDAGHTVHGTVRDPNKASSTSHLKTIAAGAPGTLELFQADLLQPGSFTEAMAGCELVIHTASPFILTGIKNPQEQLVRPALEGTENVLESVNETATIKRVVLTSSVVSTYGDAVDMAASGRQALDETDWNTTSSNDRQPYSYSKTLAEKKAWEINKKQNRWDLVTINPAAVVGPSLTPASNSASIDLLVQMGDGRTKIGVPAIELGIVDVRDVSQAHIRAAFNPDASGRYITSNQTISLLEVGKILRAEFGDSYPFPTRTLPKPLVWLVGPVAGLSRDFVSRNVGQTVKFDNSKSRNELGLEYRPVAQTLTEHFQQLIDDQLV